MSGYDGIILSDNDHGGITVTFGGKKLRGWTYADDNERRIKMLAAREYVEGWCDGWSYCKQREQA
jgi:hypothetical protein